MVSKMEKKGVTDVGLQVWICLDVNFVMFRWCDVSTYVQA